MEWQCLSFENSVEDVYKRQGYGCAWEQQPENGEADTVYTGAPGESTSVRR